MAEIFEPISMPEQASASGGKRPPRRGGRLGRLAKWTLGGLFGLVFFVALALTAAFGWLRTDSASRYAEDMINETLVTALAPLGLSARVTKLTGPLPFTFSAALEVSDGKGVFLTVPQADYDLVLSGLPGELRLTNLRVLRPVLSRLPELPPSPAEPPSPPMTQSRLRALLDEVENRVRELPADLPTVTVENISIEDAVVAKDVAGMEIHASASLSAGFASAHGDAPASISLSLGRCEILSDAFAVTAKAGWTSGTAQGRWLDGPLDVTLTTHVPTRVDEARLKAPVDLIFSLKGPLYAPAMALKLTCAHAEDAGHALKDAAVVLSASPLDWKGFLGSAGEHRELPLALAVDGRVDGGPVHMAATLFALLTDAEAFDAFTAGLRGLDLSALGVSVSGDLKALMEAAPSGGDAEAKTISAGLPRLEGGLHAAVKDWKALSAFVPGRTLSGEVSLDLALGGVAASAAQGNGGAPQNVNLTFAVPRFTVSSGKGSELSVAGLTGGVRLDDVFGRAGIDAEIALKSLAAGPLKIGAAVQVKGDATGPVVLRVTSSGGVKSRIAAQWRPGTVTMEELEVQTSTALFMPGGKAGALGIKAAPGATVAYGTAGIGVKGLDVRVTPSGRLRAQGALSPQKLDAALSLEKLDLKTLAAIIEGLPEGIAEADVRVTGSPAKPQGSFRAGVRRLAVKGVNLKPFDAALVGKIAGDALTAHLELSPDAVRTLGGKEVRVEASLPLVFAENGVPALKMDGPMRGKIRWLGDLAPLWKLSPLADRRLTGKLSIDAALSGSPAAPQFKGGVHVADSRFEDPLIGLLLQKMDCRVDVDGKAAGEKGLAGNAKLALSASDGMGGSLRVTGGCPLDAASLDIRAALDHLRPLRRQDVRISLSGGAHVTGPATAPVVKGEIIVDRGAFSLDDLETGPSGVTVLPIDEKKGKQKAKAAAGNAPAARGGADHGTGSIDLRVRAPRAFIVEGRGFFSEWKADLHIAGALTEPVVSGAVESVRGTMEFMSRRFILTRGKVDFVGGNVAEPLIDLLLTNENAGFTSHLGIAGTPKKLKLLLSSEPVMPQDEVLAHILFGRNVNELGKFELLQLTQALSQLAGFGEGGQPLDFTRNALGVDVLRLKTDDAGNGTNVAVETGKYLTDSLYVGVEQGTGEGGPAAKVQLEITPRVRLEVKTRQNDTEASLGWRYDY
ncbi:MAG: translocation/assembly module TamB [Desulfovibrio sp.]|nr:translocation/assembly module TamB [Desulfovibrio sp.]